MKLEKLDVIDVIIRKCSQVLEWTIDNDMPTDNICIFINPGVAVALKLQETLFVETEKVNQDIPIVRDSKLCFERDMGDGTFASDFVIGDPHQTELVDSIDKTS